MKTDQDLRPTSLDDFVSQHQTIATLRRAITAARRAGRPVGHLLFAGMAGCGKTSLAAVVAAEMGAKFVATTGPAIEHRGELAALLTGLGAGDVLFVDEIHGLDKKLQEILYSAMEDGVVDLAAGKKMIRMQLPAFTLIGATTRTHLLTGPLRDRFAYTFQIGHYDDVDLQAIVGRSARRLGLPMDDDAAAEIGRRSRGTPRVANRLVRAARDFVESVGATRVTSIVAAAALDAIGVDDLGLDTTDRTYLAIVAEAGAPIGLEAIASAMGTERGTIEDVIEPHLVARGLVRRTSRGRVATAAGIQHLQPRADRWAPKSRMISEGNDVIDAELVS